MAADKHYLSDTLVGAGVGSLIGWAVPYLFHRPGEGSAAGRATCSPRLVGSPSPGEPRGRNAATMAASPVHPYVEGGSDERLRRTTQMIARPATKPAPSKMAMRMIT